ncbi:MAG: hypothetical protein KJZ83_05190 [Burkholderiaceae bacterium]|nr:hypothetical protein [Burkholderiaceae bacterium]
MARRCTSWPARSSGTAISAPAGFVDGLPIGVQIIGARFREDMVMDAAEVIEARFPATTPIDPVFPS